MALSSDRLKEEIRVNTEIFKIMALILVGIFSWLVNIWDQGRATTDDYVYIYVTWGIFLLLLILTSALYLNINNKLKKL